MKKRLLLLSFIEGATVMAAELCGARLLAPIFGSSLYVWASVMGITLAALAAGYFYGGYLSASLNRKDKGLFPVLNAAALFVLLMPLLAYYLVPRISYLPFIPAVILSTLLILFIPVFLLGAASPLFISLQTNTPAEAGKVSGVIYGLSTTGGILATFATGFYLIPVAGLNMTLLLFGSLLFVSNIICFKIFSLPGPVLFIFLCSSIFSINTPRYPTKYHADGILGKIEVRDHPEGADTVRYLTVNGIIQSEMNVTSGKSVSRYVRLLDSLIPASRKSGNALVLGMGGGLTSNLLADKNYITCGVEYDARILYAAKNYFGMNSQVRSVNDDARFFLNSDNGKYDIILFDLYKAEEQPSHVITMESLRELKEKLNTGGALYINWHGYLTGRKGLGTMVLIRTLNCAGYTVKTFATGIHEDERNLVFVAKPLNITNAGQRDGQDRSGFCSLVNTDDHPLLEKYNADANKAWRTNYLRYYQSR